MRKVFYYFIMGLFFLIFIVSCGTHAEQFKPSPLPKEAPAKLAVLDEWERTLSEARKEGKVVISAQYGGELRVAVIEKFQKEYPGIAVEYTAMSTSAAIPKILQQRQAGLYLSDLMITAATPIFRSLMPYILPVEDFLLPEMKDSKNWMPGKLRFADNAGKYILVFGFILHPLIGYNTNLSAFEKLDDFSLWQFAEPQWKGKIAWSDPRRGGFGAGVGWFAYHNPQLGPDWFRAMAKNDIIFSRDDRLLIEWVYRGKYPLLIGPAQNILEESKKLGAPINAQYRVKEGSYAGSGSSHLVILDKLPHPNTTKVFLNWFLGKEGQFIFSKEAGFASLRMDVPTEHLLPESLPTGNYNWMMGEEISKQIEKVYDFSTEVFGK